MGTHLRLEVVAGSDGEAAAAEATVVEAAATWEAALSRFRTGSDLDRWRRGLDAAPSQRLVPLLEGARWWQERSGGAFSAVTGAVTDRWRAAEVDGMVPDVGELAALAAGTAAIGFDRTPTLDLDLHALAKGWVVDRLAETAMAAPGVARVVVDAGGDLVHRGVGGALVAVEDPAAPHHGAAPLETLVLADAAVATSGTARRWFEVGGRRWSRVLDPRTARPVTHTSSATVVASDAATADVVATVCSVLAPDDAVRFVDGLAADGIDAACLVVEADATTHRSTRWPGTPTRS